MRPRTIKCGSRSIRVTRPNWLTGLATIYVDDCGSKCVFTTDAAATRKLINVLYELLTEQERIERERPSRNRVAGPPIPPAPPPLPVPDTVYRS